MKFSKKHLSEIPVEEAHGGSGSRQMLFNPQAAESSKWEAVTKGFLPGGAMFDWHKHEESDEMFIVTCGTGKFFCEDEETSYKTGDVILVRANTLHKIFNDSQETTEGFFIRVRI
ncbi:MAG TPA: cupin domain-containing protein [Patescibacteria group bacterium]|nr:cupin domain-containing protein [Patescibacteria group bacterium]